MRHSYYRKLYAGGGGGGGAWKCHCCGPVGAKEKQEAQQRIRSKLRRATYQEVKDDR